jgi:hypothetical protein
MQAHRTPDGFHLVSGHPETHCWQLVDVPTFFDLPRNLLPFALTRFALARSMRDDLIGSRDKL